MFALIFIIISLAAVFYIYKFNKIPKELENVPYTSALPLVWALIQQKNHDEIQDVIRKSLKEGHDIHISRSGKTIFLNITSPEFAKDLLMESEDVAQKLQYDTESSSYKVFGDGLLFTNGDIWRAHRKLASSAFNSTLSSEMIGETALELLDFIKKKLDRPINAHEIMQRITVEVLGKLAFGHRFGYLESEETPHIINVYKFIIEMAESVNRVSFPWIDKLPLESNRKFRKYVKEFDEFIFDIIEKKRKEINNDNTDGKDLLSNMLKLSEQDEIDKKGLRDEVVTFFVAGHDTTSMSLCTTLYYLAKYPEIQEKARAEAISIFGNEPVIPTSDQLKQLKYINAIIKESLRMFPPVSAISLRKLSKPIKVGPYIIPKDILCSLNVWQIHRHPKFWDDPERYDPERFMDNEKRHPFAWIPFVAGPRNCVGQNFSLLEQRTIISMLLLKYKWTLPENSINKEKLLLISQFMLKPVNLELIFTDRMKE